MQTTASELDKGGACQASENTRENERERIPVASACLPYARRSEPVEARRHILLDSPARNRRI